MQDFSKSLNSNTYGTKYSGDSNTEHLKPNTEQFQRLIFEQFGFWMVGSIECVRSLA